MPPAVLLHRIGLPAIPVVENHRSRRPRCAALGAQRAELQPRAHHALAGWAPRRRQMWWLVAVRPNMWAISSSTQPLLAGRAQGSCWMWVMPARTLPPAGLGAARDSLSKLCFKTTRGGGGVAVGVAVAVSNRAHGLGLPASRPSPPSHAQGLGARAPRTDGPSRHSPSRCPASAIPVEGWRGTWKAGHPKITLDGQADPSSRFWFVVESSGVIRSGSHTRCP